MKMELAPRLNLITGDNGLGKVVPAGHRMVGADPDVGQDAGDASRRAWKTPGGLARGTSTIGYGYEKTSGGLSEKRR
jgi:hypothetical protein